MTEPIWLQYARKQIGIREIPGPRHSAGVMGMVKRARDWLGIAVNSDEVPWCGTFVADCMIAAGFPRPRGAIAVRAKWWLNFGHKLPMNDRPPLGAIAVFGRQGGGHVGFVVAWHTNGDLDILGGNQGNAVNVRRFPKARLVGLRWPTNAVPMALAPLSGGAKGTTGEG
jgi:uncharacterized protein (TIGR02594 family)